MMRITFTALAAIALLLGLPLLGAALTGHDVRQYTEFPPLTQYVTHAPFSRAAFVGLAILLLMAGLPFIARIVQSNDAFEPREPDRHPFPRWGWFGLAAGAVSWMLAWTRFDWFAPLQSFTFSPLWFSYIVVVNAFTQWRAGRCSLTSRPGFMAVLFLVSAGFWWFFEYLNRFVQNWAYQNVEGLSSMEYFIFATLPFSTVLPAVLGTYELLQTFPRLSVGMEKFISIRWARPRVLAVAGLLLAGISLAGIGVWPDYLFPFLWVSPLMVIVCLQTLRGQSTIFSPARFGFWRDIFLWALAALVCGFFWEMWNYKSLARWVYIVPFVQRFHIFEMPILGYSGYLTFGLECAVISDAVGRWCNKRQPPAIMRRATIRTLLALLAGAVLWLPFMHVFFKPPNLADYRADAGIPPRAAALAARQMELWSDPDLRQKEFLKMRRSNAEWDFMARTYFVLALSNMALREPGSANSHLVIIDSIIDETIRLEKENGIYHFLMDYARFSPFRNSGQRSLFQDGEIALMLAARRLVREKESYRPLLTERLRLMETQLRESRLLCGESYPDQCWMFCNAIAIDAFRMADALDGSDHSNLIAAWLQSVKQNLVDPSTGLLYSSFTLDGRPLDGPEGSSIWMIAHSLQLVDPDFAADQYRRARRELGRTALGFGWAREWPKSWKGPVDVDSGPVIPILNISPGSSGLAILAAAAFDDRLYLSALITSLNYGGLPTRKDGRLRYCASNPVGDAVLLYALVQGPLWETVNRKLSTSQPASDLQKEVKQ